MRLSALLLLSSCLLAPGAARAQETTLLAKGDLDSLRAKMQDWMKARTQARDADEGRKDAARKKEDSARDKFMKEWETKTAKKNALASLPDLRAIFAGCFEFERQTGTGDVRSLKPKNLIPYDVVVPKKYKSDLPTTTLVVMRGHDGKAWTAAADWYGATWKSCAEVAEHLFVLPSYDNTVDFDPAVDLGKPEGEKATNARNEAVVGGIGSANQSLNIDRDRIFLDCGTGSCAFGLRLVSYFPALFAGVILRTPTEPGDLRLDGLGGVPILLLRSAATKDVADRLATTLNQAQAGTATVIDAKGAYPYGESASEIAGWIKGKVRNVMRPHVVLANTHDTYRKAFWVQMLRAEQLADVAADKRPLLDVTADRATNTITVTARSVTDFRLSLNDSLVDLDKEVTVVINGKAQKPVKIPRHSIKRLSDDVFKLRDNTGIFTAEQYCEVPAETAADKPGAEKPATGKGDSPK